jgi:GNAT superfamily N-acetyltransferase
MLMSDILFRRLNAEEFAPTYAIVQEAARWLCQRGLPNWLVPPEVYQQRHTRGENYGVFFTETLRAVVTLTRQQPVSWAEYIPKEEDFIWLGTLAVPRQFRGQNWGQITLAQAEAWSAQQGISWIYLDCYYSGGVLPRYYQQAGYQWLARKEFLFEDGSLHDSVLMKKIINS